MCGGEKEQRELLWTRTQSRSWK